MKLVLRFKNSPEIQALFQHCRDHYREQRQCWPNDGKPLTGPSIMVVKDSGAYLMSPFAMKDGEPATLQSRAMNKDGGLLAIYAQGMGPDDGHIGGDDFGDIIPLPDFTASDTLLTITVTDSEIRTAVTGPANQAGAGRERIGSENLPGAGSGTKITPGLLEDLRTALQAATADIGRKHGVALNFGYATFREHNATMKLEIASLVGGVAMTAEYQALLDHLNRLGLTREQIAQPINTGPKGAVYHLVGYRPRSGKFVVTKDGAEGQYLLPAAFVQTRLHLAAGKGGAS